MYIGGQEQLKFRMPVSRQNIFEPHGELAHGELVTTGFGCNMTEAHNWPVKFLLQLHLNVLLVKFGTQVPLETTKNIFY